MHHRDTSTGHACPLGTPMCRLEACGSRWGAVTRGTLYALQTSLHGRVWQGSRHKTARMVHEDPMLMKMSMKILVVGEVA